MESSVLIALARHGQTNSNVNKLWVGRGDDPLNEKGREQARMLGIALSKLQFDYIISSNKKRSIETAEIVSSIAGVPMYGHEALLTERDYGDVEGMTSEQIRDKYGFEMKALSRELDDNESESVEAVLGRVNQFIETSTEAFNGKRIIAITHGAFIRTFYETYVRRDDNVKFLNCSHFIVRFEDGAPVLVQDLLQL